ncbi:MAG: replication-associated recombination protein A, partial [Eubacterium sp.]|nr:replication-associated recombination protein A [Eubacterium sp.]
HDFPNHYVKPQYITDALGGTGFYKPGELGQEVRIREWMEKLKKEAN